MTTMHKGRRRSLTHCVPTKWQMPSKTLECFAPQATRVGKVDCRDMMRYINKEGIHFSCPFNSDPPDPVPARDLLPLQEGGVYSVVYFKWDCHAYHCPWYCRLRRVSCRHRTHRRTAWQTRARSRRRCVRNPPCCTRSPQPSRPPDKRYFKSNHQASLLLHCHSDNSRKQRDSSSCLAAAEHAVKCFVPEAQLATRHCRFILARS